MTDQYQTIKDQSTGEFKDRGSKFLAYAFEVYSPEECLERLLEIRKLHPKARHYCFAWRLEADGSNFRINDDGEPSGTAGKPILGQIDRLALTNVTVIVVRYFGGTKLGTSGLINAYKLSTRTALEDAKIIQKTLESIFDIYFDYSMMSSLMNFLKKEEIPMLEQDFGITAKIQVSIRKSEVETTLLKLKAAIANKHLEEIDASTKVEGLTITFLETR